VGNSVRVLFLDMDGVVNSARYFEVLSKRGYRKAKGKAKAEARLTQATFVSMIDPATIPLLNDIVARGNADVVISSSWRVPWSFTDIAEMLRQRGFVGSVIGATPYGVELPSDVEYARGHEIAAWLAEHEGVESFAILDDNSDMAHLLPRLVQTTWGLGLLPEHVEPAVRLLITAGSIPEKT
jgi:hypothetical protein